MKPPPPEAGAAPRVAIVILNYNGWDKTLDCLDSLRRSSYPGAHVLLIDNASNDDRSAEVRTLHPGIEIMRNTANLGFAKGANIGIRTAMDRGFDYVWLLNNDTVVAADTLDTLVRCAEQKAGSGVVGTVLVEAGKHQTIQAWGGGTVNLWTGIVRHHKAPVPPSALDYVNGASMLLRCRALADSGLLDEEYFMYWEDIDLCLRMRAYGWELDIAPDAIVRHAVSATMGRTSIKRQLQYLRSARHFLQRYAPIPPLAMLSCLLVQLALATRNTLVRLLPAKSAGAA